MSAFSLLACVLCVLCAQGMGGLCSAPEASDSDMCVLKRASKDACGGIMSTATISITIVASFPRYASCTNSHLRRQIQRGGHSLRRMSGRRDAAELRLSNVCQKQENTDFDWEFVCVSSVLSKFSQVQ